MATSAGARHAHHAGFDLHGADIYATDMVLSPDGDAWRANGRKYYIGNGNAAAVVSTAPASR